MAYDQTGATVGAAGHDAATIVAAELMGPGLAVDTFDRWVELRDLILANSLEVQAVTALEQGTTAQPASRPRSSGNSSGGPAGGSTDIRSGKYTGKTVAEVVSEDRDYAEWAAANMKNDFLKKAFIAELAAVAA